MDVIKGLKKVSFFIGSFLQKQWFKLGIIAVLVLITFFINGYLQGKNEVAQDLANQQRVELYAAKAEKDRSYTADQKTACVGIYKQESSNWNNTTGWRYDQVGDKCYIEYKETTKKTRAQCDLENKDENGKVPSYFFRDWLLCIDGTFEKSF